MLSIYACIALVAICETYKIFSILKHALTVLIKSKKFNDRNIHEDTKKFIALNKDYFAIVFAIVITLIEAGSFYISPYIFVCVFAYVNAKLFLISRAKEE